MLVLHSTSQDAAVAARSQCASLQRRCIDLSQRLHAQRSAAAVASISSSGTVRQPSSPQDVSPTASQQLQPGRCPAPGGMRMTMSGRLPSIDELEQSSPDSSPPADLDMPSTGSLRVRTLSDEPTNAGYSGDTLDAAGGSGRDFAFLESLDSAFERWSMGDAATPPSSSTPPPASDLQGPAAAGCDGSGGTSAFGAPLYRARSAPEDRGHTASLGPPFRGFPSRGAGAAAAALSRGRISPPSPFLPRRRSLDEPGRNSPPLQVKDALQNTSSAQCMSQIPHIRMQCDQGVCRWHLQPAVGGGSPSSQDLEMRLEQALSSLSLERERGARLEALLTARQQARSHPNHLLLLVQKPVWPPAQSLWCS